MDVYARISQEGDPRQESVPGQVQECQEHIKARGWQIGKVHTDPNRSAWNPRVKRPGWDDLMQRLESGDADGVMIWQADRFARRPVEGERLIAAAERGLIVASTSMEYDLTDPNGKAHFRDDMKSAARESDFISLRSRRGKRRKAERGQSNAGPRGFAMPGRKPKPKGWERGDPEPEPVPQEQVDLEREVVQEVARRLLAGQSLTSVTSDLNDRGILTVNGRLWSTQAVRQMLRRPSLAGLIEYNGDIIEGRTLPGEPVLGRDTWDALVAMFTARRRGRSLSGIYLLTGLASCGRCSTPLSGRPRVSLRPYDDGKVRREYWCQPRVHRKGGCGRLAIDQRYADDMVRDAVLERLGDPQHADYVARRAAQTQASRDKVLTEIARAEETGRTLADRLGRGEISINRYDAAATPLDRRLTALRARLADLDGPDVPATVANNDVSLRWKMAEAAGDVDALRAMVRDAFPRLTILPAGARGSRSHTPDRFAWDGT